MIRTGCLFCVFLGIAAFAAGAPAQSSQPSDSDAPAMLTAIHALQPPQLDESRKEDEQYVQSYLKERLDYLTKLADLARQFHDKYPDNPATMDLMEHRWLILAQTNQGPAMMDETAKALAANPDAKTRTDILFIRAIAGLNGTSGNPAAAIDEFVKAAPGDERGVQLLYAEVQHEQDDAQKRAAIARRIIQLYPASSEADSVKGIIRQGDDIGKPFDLSFTDAMSGLPISVQKDLKGKVVVIDFWATWCGPCVAAMPEMKDLYAKYKDKGVEFIGVSLDDTEANAGLMNLKHFVAVNGITWPQYYQGNSWDSEFSSGWGTKATGIPCVFIVDANGNLYSTTAFGKLDTLIPDLLAKGNKATAH
jgi:thiol-disulfide isomerase/thioredoxin